MSKSLVLASVVAAGAIIAGCSGATRSGTEYTITPLREFKATLPHDLGSTHEAAVRALRDRLKYSIEESSSDALEGVVKARSATDRTVTVNTSRVGDNSTEVLVGVSPMGDEQIAREVLSAIEEELD